MSFRPAVFLRNEPQFFQKRHPRETLGGFQVYGGNGFYINESGCFVTPLSLKRRLLAFTGGTLKDVQVRPIPGPVDLQHIGDLDEHNLAVMRVAGVGTTTPFPLPDKPYKPQPGERFLIITHERVIGEVESDGQGVSSVSLIDAWGEKERVVAYWLKGMVEGASLTRTSGAPVVNSRGEAIGLWVGRAPDKDGIFALPVSRSAVADVLNQC